jgi:hypothetical protein
VNGPQRGLLVGGSWLIGIGLVLLMKEAMGWSWNQAWPLFIVLVGVASIGPAIAERRGLYTAWSLTWPVAWIGAGILLLATTTGWVSTGPAELIVQWWPTALVALGVWFVIGALVPGSRSVEDLSVPLQNQLAARVELKFGAGELSTHRAAAGRLVDGRFGGGVRTRRDGPDSITLSQDATSGLPWFDHDARWDVGLSGEVPLDLRLETGANRGDLDLAELKVARLELHTGASDTRIRLPRAAGSTSVRADCGAASLTFEVPAGVAARIRPHLTLGTSRVDTTLFPRLGDIFQSRDYESAANHVDVEVNGGLGQLTVVGTA